MTSALESTVELYRPRRRTEKPGPNRKIGKRCYHPPKSRTTKSEAVRASAWAWNDTSSHDTILDGMDYCEAFNRVISTLSSPDPTDGYDYRCVYNTTKEENFPARNLLVAVLFSSWCDLRGFGIPIRARRATVLREIAWMTCSDELYIYSFGFICDMLDINRDAVFKAMINGTDQRRKNFVTGP